MLLNRVIKFCLNVHFIILLSLLLCECFIFKMLSQQQNNDNSIIHFPATEKNISEFSKYFYNNELLFSPGVPNFILASKERNVIFGLGGYVMFRSSYDFEGVCDNGFFYTSKINVPNKGNPKVRFAMESGYSRLFFKLIIKTPNLRLVTSYIEGDFRGASNTLKLRQAYISFMGLTVGETQSSFVDLKSMVPSLDQSLSAVSGAQRNPLIRYEIKYKNIKSALSFEYSSYSAAYGEYNTSSPAIMPDIPLYVEYLMKRGHIRVSAILRNLPYKDVIDNKYDSSIGYGFKFSGANKFSNKFTGMFNAIYGKGINTYIADISSSELSLVSDMNTGKMFTPKVLSCYLGIKYNLLGNLYVSTSSGYIRVDLPDDFTGTGKKNKSEFYKQGFIYDVNLIWEFMRYAFCGIEYMYGRRENYSKQTGRANRIGVVLKYSF